MSHSSEAKLIKNGDIINQEVCSSSQPKESPPSYIPKALELLDDNQIPEDFRERGIRTGYRNTDKSLHVCIRSLLHIHNETVNIWTQIIPAVYFLCHFVSSLHSDDPFSSIYLATCVLFLLTSACAHTFSCYSLRARHICFFFDYAAIALYSCGCAVTYYAYTLPAEFMQPFDYIGADLCDIYLFFSVFLSIWCSHLSGITRFWKQSYFQKVVRIVPFALTWMYLAVPVAYRIISCAYYSHLLHTGECTSMHYWILQFISSVTAGILYISHFPECIFPGTFDTFGHSHQIFHIFGASACINQYKALQMDNVERKSYLRSLNHSPSYPLCILCILVVIFANLLVFSNFYKKLCRHKHKHV